MCSPGTGYRLLYRLLFHWLLDLGRLVVRLVFIGFFELCTGLLSGDTGCGLLANSVWAISSRAVNEGLLKDCKRLRFTVVGCNGWRFLTNRWIQIVKPIKTLHTGCGPTNWLQTDTNWFVSVSTTI